MKSHYDSNHLIFNPQGRLLQVHYANESTLKGGCVVMVRNERHAVLLGLSKRLDDLAYPDNKIFSWSEKVAFAACGISTDVLPVYDFLEQKIFDQLEHENSKLYADQLVNDLAKLYHDALMDPAMRPFGIKSVLACLDHRNSPRIFVVEADSTVMEVCYAAVGRKAQTAQSYLETHKLEIGPASSEELIKIALQALRAAEPEVTDDEVSYVLLSNSEPFRRKAQP